MDELETEVTFQPHTLTTVNAFLFEFQLHIFKIFFQPHCA